MMVMCSFDEQVKNSHSLLHIEHTMDAVKKRELYWFGIMVMPNGMIWLVGHQFVEVWR